MQVDVVSYYIFNIEPAIQEVKSTTNDSPTQISESNDDQQKGALYKQSLSV